MSASFLRKVACTLGIFAILLSSLALFANKQSVYADDHYFVGDILTVPITYTSTLPVTITSFSIDITGGELVKLTCGGSGFIVNIGSDTQCTLVHLPPSTASGTVAVAQVKATKAGTLTVKGKGSLEAILGIDAGGKFVENSFEISERPSSTPTPSASATSGTQSTVTSTSQSVSQSSTQQTTQSVIPIQEVQTAVTTSNTTSTVSTQKNTVVTTTNTTARNTSGASTVTESKLIITAADTSPGKPITVGDYQKVYFTSDAIAASTVPVVLDFSGDGNETWLDFSSYMQPGQAKAQVLLPQALTLRNKVGDNYISTTIPMGTSFWSDETTSATGDWNGLMLTPTATESSEGSTKVLTVSIGDFARSMKMDKPVEMVLGSYSGWTASVRENAQQAFADIPATCGVADNRLKDSTSGDCRVDDGSDLHIFTNHFSEFRFTHQGISWETILLGIIEVLLLAFILITLRPQAMQFFKNRKLSGTQQVIPEVKKSEVNSKDNEIEVVKDEATKH